MNNNDFEFKYEQLIAHAPLGEILSLFKEKKKLYSGNQIKLIYEKIKDKFTKDKNAHFFQLGYDDFSSFDLFNKMYALALKNERADVIEYFFVNKYVKSYLYSFELARLVSSKKVLSKIIENKELEKSFSSYDYYAILEKAVMHNLPEIIDLIFELKPEKVKKIEKKLQEKLLLQAIHFNADEVFFKLLHVKEPIEFDINFKQDQYGINHERDNLLIFAAKNNKIELMRYLLTSPKLDKHVDLAESIHWIMRLKNGDMLLNSIIFDIKAPLTKKLEELLKDEKLLEIFKKRDLMLKISNKLEPKENKIKPKKI